MEREERRPAVSFMEQEQIHRDDLARAVKGAPKPKGTRMEKLRHVVERHSASRVDGKYVDVQTAIMLIKIHDALGPEHQAKFTALPMWKMIDVGWKLVK